MHKFSIVCQVSPETKTPFRVIETYQTGEGVRSRICQVQFARVEDAANHIAVCEDTLKRANR